jgi:hypothetical protein
LFPKMFLELHAGLANLETLSLRAQST